MVISRIVLGVFAAAALLFAAGCNNDNPADNTEPIPGAHDDLTSGNSTDLTGGSGWNANGTNGSTASTDAGAFGTGATDASLGGNGSDWSAVDPGKNLGFPVIYFGYDTDVLPPEEAAKLDRVAGYLNANAQLGLIVEGHCDQRGTEEYNRALGDRRANSIRAYLAGRGLADGRMKTISYGEDRPAVDGSDEAAWKQNRRGVLVPAKMN